ncbi:hypothetical protein EDB87DRAFT_1156655 [Lactarius vividus]|nr:hypothetical protein EDB87DRAFT_1156655 [Lactarius vividus]
MLCTPYGLRPMPPTAEGRKSVLKKKRDGDTSPQRFSTQKKKKRRDKLRDPRSGKTYVNKGGHCAGAPGATAVTATETLAGAKGMTVMTTVLLGMGVGTVVLCVVGAGVACRRAPGSRFGRRFGLGRRWHDDFYLGIGVEDVLGLNRLASSSSARDAF